MTPGLAELRGYRRAWLAGDLLAGVTVAAYLVPQVMAYATIAGLPPVTGLWAAVPALIVYVLFGSSKSLSMGPEATTALMTVVAIKPLAAGDPARYAELASTLALLTGLMAVAAGPAAGGAARHRRRGGLPPGRGRRRRARPGPAAHGAAARPSSASPWSSRTGNALTRYSVSKPTMSLNVAPFLTATTRVVITSRTLALISTRPFPG